MTIEELENLMISHSTEFEIYFNELVAYNQHTNLTAITEKGEVFVKHFLDSILPIDQIKQGASVVDVGSGAGFPGLPIKIVRPDINLTMVDSLNKRINFLNILCGKLNENYLQNLALEKQELEQGLPFNVKISQPQKNYAELNIQQNQTNTNLNTQTKQNFNFNTQPKQTYANINALHARAEDFCKTNREKFDVAVARAVAKLNTLLEYLLPLVKVGGIVLAYKGNNLDELSESQNAISVLGGKLEKTLSFTLPENAGTRNIFVIKKIKPTPAIYPRSQNKPKSNPL